MEKNKLYYLRRLSLIVFLFCFGVVNLFAQNNTSADSSGQAHNPVQEGKIDGDDFVTNKNFYSEISGIKDDVDKIKSLQEAAGETYNIILERALKPQIWQIISALSIILGVLMVSGTVVLLFLGRMKFHVVSDLAEAGFPRKGHSSVGESGNAAAEISTVEFNVLKSKLDEIQSNLRQLNSIIDSQSKDVSGLKNNLTSVQTEIADNDQKIKNIEAVIYSLKTDIVRDKEKYTWKDEVESDPVKAFNMWAQNSRQPLPKYFTYVAIVKLEFRTKQEFSDTYKETDWIRNIIGEKKYLFPNPNNIDSLSGPADKLYKVTGMRKGQGANSVKITSACQIKEGNFIEYQGELILM